MAKTTCYKCESEIEVSDETVVHPLCDDCDQAWLEWFNTQLAKLDGV